MVITADRNANSLHALDRDWAIVARQPLDSMRWEYQVPIRELRAAIDGGKVRTLQRRDADCYVLLARMA